MDLWKTINAPIFIFALTSIGVLSVTRYLDARRVRRVEAQEMFPYVIECLNRVEYVLANWPEPNRLLLSDYWNINNALRGEGRTSFYPLVKKFSGEPIEGLFTFLSLRLPRLFELLGSWHATIDRWHSVDDGLTMQEFDELKGAPSAEFFTGYTLTNEKSTELDSIRALFEEHLDYLEQTLVTVRKELQ